MNDHFGMEAAEEFTNGRVLERFCFVYVVLKVYSFIMAQWLSWLERRPVTAEVESSSLFWVVCFKKKQMNNGILAQLGEHLPYKQRVIGSRPRGPIDAGVAELADAQDLKSCCGGTVPVRFRSPALQL